MRIEKMVSFFMKRIKKKQSCSSISTTSADKLLNFNLLYPEVKLHIVDEKELYHLFFLIHKEFLSLFEYHFNFKHENKKVMQLDQSKKFRFDLKIRIIDDFGGYIIEVMTSSKQMIEDILNIKSHPPSPEISFPKLNPEEYYGSLQGSIDFWFSQLWDPYWRSLSKEDKTSLPLSASWRELINFRLDE